MNYVLTDEALRSLVDGKLSCEMNPDPEGSRGFLVSYDSVSFSPASGRVVFSWNLIPVMEVIVPKLDPDSTVTVSGLMGKIPVVVG